MFGSFRIVVGGQFRSLGPNLDIGRRSSFLQQQKLNLPFMRARSGHSLRRTFRFPVIFNFALFVIFLSAIGIRVHNLSEMFVSFACITVHKFADLRYAITKYYF